MASCQSCACNEEYLIHNEIDKFTDMATWSHSYTASYML